MGVKEYFSRGSRGRGPIRNRGVDCTVEASGFPVFDVRNGENSDWSILGREVEGFRKGESEKRRELSSFLYFGSL